MQQPRFSKSRSFAALIITVLVFCIVVLLRQMGWLQSLELTAYDLNHKFRPAMASENSAPIVIVRIDESDLKQWNYPLSDRVIADAIEKLMALNASVIGIDIFRDFASKGRDALSRVAADHPPLVFIEKVLGTKIAAPEFVTRDNQKGFADLKQDADGVIRRGLLMLWDDDGKPRLSFSLRVALNYLAREGVTLSADPDDEQQVRLGKSTIERLKTSDGGYQRADIGGYQYLLRYQRGSRDFNEVAFSQLMDGNVSADLFNNAIVLLGVTAASVNDRHETPLSTGLGNMSPMHGIEIHAHIVEQLLQGVSQKNTIVVQAPWLEYLIIFTLALLGALIAVTFEQRVLLLGTTLMLLFASMMIVSYFAMLNNLWFTSVPAVVALMLSAAITAAWLAKRERLAIGEMKNLFGKYVSPEVASYLWLQRDAFMEEGKPKPQQLDATVLITDLEGFVSTTQNMGPGELMEWLNNYLDAMTQVAMQHGGFVDDYAGDGIKINFGVPVPRNNQKAIAEDACAAVNCALEMAAKVEQMNQQSRRSGKPEFRLRAGIHSGVVVVGSLGSSERMKYTTVGDVVNTAARLESLQKNGFDAKAEKPWRILIGEQTRKLIKVAFEVNPLGMQSIPGKTEPMAVYSVNSKAVAVY